MANTPKSNSDSRLVLTRNVSRTASEMEAVSNMESIVETEVNSYSPEGRAEAALRLAGIASRVIDSSLKPNIETTVKNSPAAENIAFGGLEKLISELQVRNEAGS